MRLTYLSLPVFLYGAGKQQCNQEVGNQAEFCHTVKLIIKLMVTTPYGFDIFSNATGSIFFLNFKRELRYGAHRVEVFL